MFQSFQLTFHNCWNCCSTSIRHHTLENCLSIFLKDEMLSDTSLLWEKSNFGREEMLERFLRKIGSYEVFCAIFVILFGMICFFIDIINVVIGIVFIICQKCMVFTMIFAEFLVLCSNFFCFLFFIVWMPIRTTIFFSTNRTIFFQRLKTIMIVLVRIVSIVALVVMVCAIM